MDNLTSSQERKLRDAFNLFDKDRSGQISKRELKNVLKALQIKVDDKELQVLLNQMDGNRSGEIDFNEFKAVMAEKYFRGHHIKELEVAFKKYDSDGNGFITTDEFQIIMSNMGRRMSRNEIKSMMQSLDLNHDGKISFQEFTKLFD